MVGPRGGGNPISAFTGRVFTIHMIAFWNVFLADWVPTPAFAADIKIVKAFFEQVANKSTNGTTHPLLGISKIVLTKAQYVALADLVYGSRKLPAKALGQLMCYMAMQSRYDGKRNTHTLTFNKTNWNFAGHRLTKYGSSGGRPSVNYVYTLDDENTHLFLQEFYDTLPTLEQEKWTWAARFVTVSRQVSHDPVSGNFLFDKTAIP